jgi:short-subunit dehydrogenase
MPIKAVYAASKRFLLDLSLALREELEPMGVNLTIVCPAGMPTTDENIRAIDAQGWAGDITTRNVGDVAFGSINASLRGKSVFIPGFINQVLRDSALIIPPNWIARIIASRWSAAHSRRAVAQKGEIVPEVI